MSGPTYGLLSAATVTGAGAVLAVPQVSKQIVVQAYGSTSAGTGAATIQIYGSRINDVLSGVLMGTITLTLGTVVTYDGFATEAPWSFMWANVSAISGTNASVNVQVGT